MQGWLIKFGTIYFVKRRRTVASMFGGKQRRWCNFGIDSVMRYYDKEEGGEYKGAFVLSQRCECEKVVDEKAKQQGFILRDPAM